jgi:hypothetical protein
MERWSMLLLFSPTDHMFVGSKAPWFTITDALPSTKDT